MGTAAGEAVGRGEGEGEGGGEGVGGVGGGGGGAGAATISPGTTPPMVLTHAVAVALPGELAGMTNELSHDGA